MTNNSSTEDLAFEVLTPLDFAVRVTRSHWELIVTIKHPVMSGHESDVKETLTNPNEIRVSRSDPPVYLFYKLQRRGDGSVRLQKGLMAKVF